MALLNPQLGGPGGTNPNEPVTDNPYKGQQAPHQGPQPPLHDPVWPNQNYGEGSYGDIVHWTGQMQFPNQGPQQGPQQQGPLPPTMAPWNYVPSSGGGGGFSYGGINYGDYQPTTREVQDEELASWQLQQMLESDSPYMDQARRAGERAAAQRGALSSSIFAGASQASAIQAAAPIAQSDATAFRAAASENMQAKNQMTMAKLSSETSVLQSTIGASAQVASANIAAQANKEVANMRIMAERDFMEFNAATDRFMENLKFDHRGQLMEMGFGHDINMANLSHTQQQEIMELAQQYGLEEIGYSGQWESYLNDRQLQSGFINNLTSNIFQSFNTISQLDVDEDGFQAATDNMFNTMNYMMSLYNSLMHGGGWPDMGGGPNLGPQPGGG